MTWLGASEPAIDSGVMDGTESGLRLMRRLTRWTLIGVALLTILVPATQLVTRDLSAPALIGLAVGLGFVGVVQWQLMLAGMAGFQGVTPAVWRVGAAAVVALILWGAAGADDPSHWTWALPFSSLVAGSRSPCPAAGATRSWPAGCRELRGRVRARAGNPGGRVGRLVGFTYALLCVAQVWIWDVTMRLDEARTQAGEVAVLRERLRFAGDLHDIQGHQLQAIALKAQLAARLIGVDDERPAGTPRTPTALALEALAETRELVQGYRRVGLADELANAVGILKAAGVSRGRGHARGRSRSRCSRCSGRSCARGRRTCSATPAPTAARSRSSATATTWSCAWSTTASARGVPDADGSGVAGLRERFAAVGGRVEADAAAPRRLRLPPRAAPGGRHDPAPAGRRRGPRARGARDAARARARLQGRRAGR